MTAALRRILTDQADLACRRIVEHDYPGARAHCRIVVMIVQAIYGEPRQAFAPPRGALDGFQTLELFGGRG